MTKWAYVKEDNITKYIENWIRFKDGNSVVFIDKDKKNHLLLRPGQTLTLDNLGTPKNQKVVYRELKITYPTWLKKIKAV